jgi:hypothetical protein
MGKRLVWKLFCCPRRKKDQECALILLIGASRKNKQSQSTGWRKFLSTPAEAMPPGPESQLGFADAERTTDEGSATTDDVVHA